jgi:hypothetical protein
MEIDPDERPIAKCRVPGIANLDSSYWAEGWAEFDHDTGEYIVIQETNNHNIGDLIDLETCIKQCCEDGDVSYGIEELREALIDSIYEDEDIEI